VDEERAGPIPEFFAISYDPNMRDWFNGFRVAVTELHNL